MVGLHNRWIHLMIRIEEAAKCRVCGDVGYLVVNQKADSPSTGEEVDLSVYECQNRVCLNYGSNNRWLVQSDKRGIVYERNRGPRGMDKDFPTRSNEYWSKGKAIVEDAIGSEYDPNSEEVEEYFTNE